MKASYNDITSKMPQTPLWHDQHGTPRYDPFAPHLCPDIYSSHVVLLRIACQDCGQRFDVEMHAPTFGHFPQPRELHYGDPPAHHGCVGETMNCEDLQVLEVWSRGMSHEWERRSDLEGLIDQEPIHDAGGLDKR